MSRFAPISPELLARRLVAEVQARHSGDRPLRIGLDAPGFLDLSALIDAVTAELRALGRPVATVLAADFYRDASLRFEYGKQDVESFYAGWLDTGALQREVLTAAASRSCYLPSLRDPLTNRATRTEPQPLAEDAVLLVRGDLLLGVGLSFDLVAHFAVTRQARRRLVPDELAWQLPAWDRYDSDVDPSALADVVIRYDDPQRPALRVAS